jgi:hypothetical protein
MHNRVGVRNRLRLVIDAGRSRSVSRSRGWVSSLGVCVFVAMSLASAPPAYAAGEASPAVTPTSGGFTWESQGFGAEWGYDVAVSRCEKLALCEGETEEYKVEKIPGVQLFVPYAQNIAGFTPEATVWVGVAVLPTRNGKHLNFRTERVAVPLQGVRKGDRLAAPAEFWTEGADVHWSGVSEEIPNLAYKVAVSLAPRFCTGENCRATQYPFVPAQSGRTFSPCIGHLGFEPEPSTVYIGVAALKFPAQPEPAYTGSEVAVKPPPCPPPSVTATVSSVTQSFAELEGDVDPLGSKEVDCRFEYATAAERAASGKYGHEKPCHEWSQTGEPTAAHVTLPLAELAPETRYDFRLVATAPKIGVGESVGTFTTLARPVPPPEKHPPVELAAPALKGTPIAGYAYSLTVTSGSWAYQPGYAYQWQRCDSAGNACANVVGATANSFPLSGIDVGHRLRAIVTASNADGSVQASSGNSAVIGSTVGSAAEWEWARPHAATLVVGLTVSRVPVGGSLELSCAGLSCPFHAKKIDLTQRHSKCKHRPCRRTGAGSRTQLTLVYPFGRRKLRPGTVLAARVTKAGWATRVSQFTMRGKGREGPVYLCLVPGASRAIACPS